MNIYYQEGGQEMGQEEQLMQLFQAFADIVQDDEFNTAEEVMQMFMELAPEEQQAFVQQAIQIIQQEQGEPELESNPEEELMEQQEVQPMMQQGGINPQKIQQILQAYASSIGEDPNVILQQFQQMQPEEQQQALQQIVQQLQGGEEEQMQMQEQQQMQDGGYVNNTGYLEGYESSNNPYNIIPSNRITMKGVDPKIKYIKGTDNLGNTQYMEHGGEYKFDGDFVLEEPVYAQVGRKQSTATSDIATLLSNAKNKKTAFKNKEEKFAYNNYLEYLNKLNQKAKLLGDKIKNTDFEDERLNYTQQLEEIFKNANLASPLNVKTKTINLGRGVYVNDYEIYKPKGKSKIVPKVNNTEPKQTLSETSTTTYKEKFIPNTDIEILEQPKDGYYIGSDGNQYYSKDKGKSFEIIKDVSPPTNQTKTTITGKKTPVINKDKADWTNSWLNSGLLIDLPKDKKDFVSVQKAVANFVKERGDDDINLQKNLTDGKFGKTTASITPNPYIAETIPDVLNPDTFDYRQPLIIDSRFDEYSIPEEDRTVELNPNVFNRSNVGVGKKFFNQTGGYNYAQDGFKPRKFKSELDFNSRLNPGSSMNMGVKSDGDFEYAYPDKKKVYYVNGAAQLDPINQYDKMPIGANSMNYEAPNAESMKMWNRGSDRILDLANYADRFGVEHFGANTKPVSDQNVDRKSKFQQFMDKYGKKADMQFDPVPVQSAPLYNLLKASEPLAPQFRGQMDVRYAEKPMVDPRPFIQELQNQYALSSRNINSNSPTGMAWQSNLQAKMKAGVEDILNKTSAANQQTAAENELSRINAFNQEQQANNTYNQQYVQSMLQAQAAKDLAMGESLSSLDQLRANAVKARNNFKSLAVMTPGLKPVENFNTLLTGSQGFNIDKDFQQLVSTVTQAKTPEEVAAAQKIYSDALKKKQAAAKAATETKQIGGKINDFFRKRY